MDPSERTIMELCKQAVDIRSDILEMIPAGKVGHLGGSMSIADIVTVLYFEHMRAYPDPKDPRRDRCLCSKGHAVLAQYACFARLGYISRSSLASLKTLEGMLQGHPDMATPGIEAVTGSLGQGLSIALGMALGFKLDKSDSRVFCILGDGELAEGQIWEAAMAAAAYKADNLCAILDWNGVQATDTVENVLPIPSIKEKWEAFGWHTQEIDGHDIPGILAALEKAKMFKGKPSILLARTIKGKGVPFAHGKAKYHNAGMSEEEYAAAWAAIEQMRKGERI